MYNTRKNLLSVIYSMCFIGRRIHISAVQGKNAQIGKKASKLFNGYFKKKNVTVQKSVWSYVEGLCHCVTPLHYHFNGHESRGWEETLHTKIMTFVLGGPPQYFRKLCSCFKAVFSFYLKHLVSCFRQ